MSEKKRIPVSYIFAGLAAVVCMLCIYDSLFISIMSTSEMRELMFYDVFIPFFNTLNSLIFLYLVLGLFLYRRTSNAVPIVLISYSLVECYFSLSGLFSSERTYLIELTYFLFTLWVIVLSVIWALKPNKFKYLVLLYIPYIVYHIYLPIAFASYGYSFVYNMEYVLLFLAVVVKCIDSKGTEWIYYRKTYYYWIPGVILVIIYIICYFISLRVSPGI